MSYVANKLLIPAFQANIMNRVLDYIHSVGRAGVPISVTNRRTRWHAVEPVVFGPYVVATLLNRPLPQTMDVLVDLRATTIPMPPNWSCIPTDGEKLTLTLDEHILEAYDCFSVPGVMETVRLFIVSRPASCHDVLNMLPLGVEQVAYDGNEKRKPVFSELFRQNLKHKVVTVAREDTYEKSALRPVQRRGQKLADVLGFKGLGRLRKPTEAS